MRDVPEANGRWSERRDPRSASASTSASARRSADRGLVVPVIRDAGRLDLAGIAGALGALVAKARDDALTPADLQGRHVHDLESRRQRQPARGADRHQPAAVGDPRRRQAREARGRRVRERATTARDPALLLRDADDRPPGAGRLPGEPVHGDLRAPPRELALTPDPGRRAVPNARSGVSKLKLPEGRCGGAGHVYTRS